GSGFLNGLQPGDSIKARLVKNKHFRFPKRAKKIIMISNGTGIAPFLGMISGNRKKIPIALYCGFRNQSSFTLHKEFIEGQQEKGKLSELHLVLSREQEKEYVSHRLLRNGEAILDTLNNGGV